MARLNRSQLKRLREEHPDEPWLWRPDWAEGVVRGSGRAQAAMLGVMAIIFVGLSLPGVWSIPEELAKGNHVILVVLLFTIVGLGLGWVALGSLRQYLRFGPLGFALEPCPRSWGGRVGGDLQIPKGAWITGEVKFTLRCSRIRLSGSGKNRSRQESVLWEDDQRFAPAEVGGMGLVRKLPVSFIVERGGGKPSDITRGNDYIRWSMNVVVPVRGQSKPLAMGFEIPVFDRGESLEIESELSAKQQQDLEQRRQSALAEAGVQREVVAGDEVWRFHQPSAFKHTIVLIVFAGVFGAVAWFAPFLILQLAFGFFAVLMAAIVPGILWHRSELRIGDSEMELRKRGLRGWKSWRIRGDEIAALELGESMRAGTTHYMRLRAIGAPGVDPERPHPAEHFRARKARYRWRRETRDGSPPSPATRQALLDTPCFEIELAGYLQGVRAAEDVKTLLARDLGLADE